MRQGLHFMEFSGDIRPLFTDLISALSMVLDVEENRKLYHGWRVAAVSGLIAEKMAEEDGAFTPEDSALLFYAGLLHDIGGIGLPDHMVHYSSLESQLAVPEIMEHPTRGAKIIGEIPWLSRSARFLMEHHEYWNGGGYPAGKRDDEIALEAQILRLADTLDLIIRSHPGTPWRVIATELAKGSGVEFSEDLLSACRDVFRREETFCWVADETALVVFVKEMEGRFSQAIPPGSGRTTAPGGHASSNERDGSYPIYDRSNPGLYHFDPIGTVLGVFAKVIDAKHRYTAGHSERVALYCQMIGEAMGLSEEDLERLRFAALLHDTGKVAVPRRILDKNGSLSDEEREVIKRHPKLTIEIVGSIRGFGEVARIAGHHHERYDGKGYPHGLKGEEIPLGSRIMAVADALDAMTSSRPYQRRRSWQAALKVLERNSGTQFDPKVVAVARSLEGSLSEVVCPVDGAVS